MRTENCSVTENRIYSGSWKFYANLLSLLLRNPEENLSRKRANRRVVGHNLYPLEYKSSVETLVPKSGQICCR